MKKRKPSRKARAFRPVRPALSLTLGGENRCELEVSRQVDAPTLGNLLALTALSYKEKLSDDYPVKALVTAADILESSGAAGEGGSEPARVYFLEVVQVIALYAGIFYGKEINSPLVKTPDFLKAIREWASEYWREHFFREEQEDLLKFTREKMDALLKVKPD